MTTENAVSSAVTRRDVLKGAAALSAAGVAASALPLTHAVAAEEVTDVEGNLTVPSFLVKPEPITDFAETVDYDVVVVGAGEAGLSAIHTALEAGATVACLQNTSIPFTTGNMAACIDLEKTDEAAIQACLSMINWKAIEAGEEEISQVTLALSAFYRTTLNKGRTWISLRLALQNIQAYVQLQLWMHDNDFNVHYDVDEKLLDYELPSLIFQPFVENALEHGLDIKEDPDHQIWFRIWEDPQTDLIYVSIRDNGVGMDTDTLAHVLEYHATGYGVKNVNDRMKLSFGEAYTIQIKSEQGKGTEVLLHFPKVQKGESNES